MESTDYKNTYVIINKNRGWRGLSEVQWKDEDRNLILKMIFSFSPKVWNDMLSGYIVLQSIDNYYVLQLEDTTRLPEPTQQRSVLIKHAIIKITNVTVYDKTTWVSDAMKNKHYDLIYNFTKNSNNHTTSDWNCIGIRVTPII